MRKLITTTTLAGLGALAVIGTAGCGSHTVPQAPKPPVVQFTDGNGYKCATDAAVNQAGTFYCPANPALTRPPVQTPAPPATQSPAPAAPAPTQAPAGPTVSQQQALTSAQSYLSDGQGFSRAGLIQQLSSSAGEGFGVADATWAVDHSGADWNAQAVMSAKGYMSDGQGFSRAGLIDQLTSSAGEGFTYAQATYAVNRVGL
jgi:hypothetical protein